MFKCELLLGVFIVNQFVIVSPHKHEFLYPGYGFVDFEHPGDAEKATQALSSAGIQAQMAKVSKVSHFLVNLLR